MSMTDYTEFDAALLAAITAKPETFCELTSTRNLYATAHVLAKPRDSWGYKDPDRVFDRRLQALRRAGKIRYTGKVWEAIDD